MKVSFLPVGSRVSDLAVLMHVWTTRNLSVSLNMHSPISLTAYINTFHIHDFNAVIGAVYPTPLITNIFPVASPGQDLRVIQGTYNFSFINVDLNIWLGINTLNVWVYGLYFNDFSVDFTMGGSYRLLVPLPMTTGYRELTIMLKPASRVLTTVIPVYTTEKHDLHISINQGWPCGFYSTYKLLDVTFKVAYLLAFTVVFKVIHGSGTPVLGVYLNKHDFNTYINSYSIQFSLPVSAEPVPTIISNSLPLTYQNQFDDIVQGIVQIRFSWPRIRLYSGQTQYAVELFCYKGDLFIDMAVQLFADKLATPPMPPTEPLVQRVGKQDPIWPAVFQITQIELWEADPPELIRLIDVMFGEQVTQYYWMSSEQRAYKKNDYENWSLLTRGYLPSAQYSGQIDYVTMYELSDMKNYPTIDAALRAMITNFSYSDKTSLDINFAATGGYTSFNVLMDIWGRGRISNLAVNLEPAHPCDLAIEFTCI